MAALDLTVVESLVSELDDRAVVREIVRTYLDLLPARRRSLADALRGDDLERLRGEAHTLGSASAMVGAVELGRLCRALETVVTGPVDPALVTSWSSSCDATTQALLEWVARP